LAVFGSLALAFFYPIYQDLPSLITETFVVFLVSALVFAIIKSSQNGSFFNYLLIGVCLGALSLVKVLFGTVIPIALLLLLLLGEKKKYFTVTGIAWLIVVLPWLFYTQQLTSKSLYWANSGGMSLYWMSSPALNEYGDWNNETFTANCNNPLSDCNAAYFEEYHLEDMSRIRSLLPLEKDEVYKEIALKNIMNHPFKYAKNIGFNWSRMLFGTPFSYTEFKLKTIIRFPTGVLSLIALIFCSIQILNRWKKEEDGAKFLWLVLVFYLGASSVVSAYPRMFNVIIPILLVLAVQTWNKRLEKEV
jgi:4-amino-4-deoxy-L-arabinose transferase-like glycosyltransferase